MKIQRLICAALTGAMMMNCTADSTDGPTPESREPEANALEEDAAHEDALLTFDAPETDEGRGYYAVRSHAEAPQRFVMQGFDAQGNEMSRLTAEHFTDPHGDPWFQLELDDEDVSLRGHLRLISADDDAVKLELDAEIDGRIVAIRLDPGNPQGVEVLGFPGAPVDTFVALSDAGMSPMLQRVLDALTRQAELAPKLTDALETPDGIQFRVSGCGPCILQALSALVGGVGCVAAVVAAAATCGVTSGVACPAAIAVASGACVVGIGEIRDFIEDCKGACAENPPVEDPCSGGCSCPGGPV